MMMIPMMEAMQVMEFTSPLMIFQQIPEAIGDAIIEQNMAFMRFGEDVGAKLDEFADYIEDLVNWFIDFFNQMWESTGMDAYGDKIIDAAGSFINAVGKTVLNQAANIA